MALRCGILEPSALRSFFVISGLSTPPYHQVSLASASGWREFGIRRVIRSYPMYRFATTVKLVIAGLPFPQLYFTWFSPWLLAYCTR